MAAAAAFSHDWVLVPISSITLYTLSAMTSPPIVVVAVEPDERADRRVCAVPWLDATWSESLGPMATRLGASTGSTTGRGYSYVGALACSAPAQTARRAVRVVSWNVGAQNALPARGADVGGMFFRVP